MTLRRLKRLAPAARTAVVSSRDLGRLTRREARAHPGTRVLLEPAGRNTAAAIAWAAAHALGRGADGVLGVFPSDHHIPDAAAFARTVRSAARAAADGASLVLVGIEPRRPDPAYGYLRLAGSGTAPRVRQFIEKPPVARARRYARSGHHLWNAGMVLARPERILDETRALAPEVWRPLGRQLDAIAAGRRVAAASFARAYRRVRPLSFDYAVLERSRRVRAVRGRFAWSDLGSWDALGEHLPAQGDNRVHSKTPPVALDARDNTVWNATDKTLVLVGVRDLVVVETADATLICERQRAQDVRRVVDELSRRGRKELT